MEDNTYLFKSIVESTTDFSITSFKLAKLKTIDKASDVISTIVPNFIVITIIAFVLIFINIGLALWVGEIVGKIYFGFLIVSAFYCIIGIIIHFIMRKWLKKTIYNYIINKMLN